MTARWGEMDILKTKQSNMVVSSLILRLSFCKIASEADGQSKLELLSALGMKDKNMLKTCYSSVKTDLSILTESDLILLNKIYVNYTSHVKSSFITDSWQNYGVLVEKISFKYKQAAKSFINRWVEVNTYKRITDIINDNDIDESTAMIIVNAAHMKPTWEFPFNIKYTTQKTFRLNNNTVIKIPMMTKVDQILYLDDELNDLEMISMHLGARGFSICIIVPNSVDSLPKFLDKLSKDPDMMIRNRNNMKWTYLKVELPRFKIKFLVDLTEYLKGIGLKSIFDLQSSGLDSISNNNTINKMYLNRVKQKIFFELDEMGPYRQINPSDYMMQDISPNARVSGNLKYFAATKPFYFTITMETGHAVEELFNGVYYGY
ncbi:serine protease inhibitor 3/4-like [Achroia grisella]|uniref:serine protease inhibitor 3/4-like n=1 Tax=Achroia grisella TaxID=688607 RepID=UPI0027D28BBA|nr:serine protease inhibitor 3/4-like [Achroia grisella]